jgi:hypothetical protein
MVAPGMNDDHPKSYKPSVRVRFNAGFMTGEASNISGGVLSNER